jgi:hypothetical protein
VRPADRIAPIIVMPEIAFEPDISGVCKVGGTFVITSKPRKIASTKTVSAATNASIACRIPEKKPPRTRGRLVSP